MTRGLPSPGPACLCQGSLLAYDMGYIRAVMRTAVLTWKLGLRAGFLGVLNCLPGRQSKLARMMLPGSSQPVWLRLGTTDWEVLWQIYGRGDYETSQWPQHDQALLSFYKATVISGKVPIIIDCGANIGLSAVWFADKFPQARILAVEPEPENFAVLKRNAFQRPNIIPINAAISDHHARLRLTNSGSGSWAWETEPTAAGEVEAVTVPDLLKDQPNGVLFIAKIDIEGGEVSLFRSNVDWAEECPMIVCEPHDWLFLWRGTAHAILSRLVSQPRDYLFRGENIFAFAHFLRG